MILNRTIILVEDSDSDRLLFSKYLKHLGYECSCMDSADKLISLVDSLEPSVILMDIEMPGITGLEAAAIIRERQETSGKKHIIIALTAHNDDNILRIVATAGFDDYLQKPITKRELKTRLSRYLNSEPDVCQVVESLTAVNGCVKDKLYSLDMFEADDPDFVRSIVEMFVSNTPGSIAAIKQAFEQNEMETLRQQAHKLKPHFSFFGAPEIQQAMQKIEDIARGHDTVEKLPELIECAEKTSTMMIAQMKADLLS
jgi:CheY-like chemotaxis protein